MNPESDVSYSEPNGGGRQVPTQTQADAGRNAPAETETRPATVIVRGEVAREPPRQPPPAAVREQPHTSGQERPTLKQQILSETPDTEEVSASNVTRKGRLPALDDDGDVGVSKEQLVIRDSKADLTFTGALLASAAPTPPVENSWEEYRIYETTAGKHVFSKVTRSVLVKQPDRHEAEVFDPAPSSMPSKLLRGARDLTHSRPMSWTDAAVNFFGYNPLSKILYRKLGSQFDEHIS